MPLLHANVGESHSPNSSNSRPKPPGCPRWVADSVRFLISRGEIITNWCENPRAASDQEMLKTILGLFDALANAPTRSEGENLVVLCPHTPAAIGQARRMAWLLEDCNVLYGIQEDGREFFEFYPIDDHLIDVRASKGGEWGSILEAWPHTETLLWARTFFGTKAIQVT